MAIDSGGNVWVANFGGGSVTKLNPSGVLVGNFTPAVPSFDPSAIAIDSADNVWLTSVGIPPGTVTKLSSSGGLVGDFHPSGSNFSDPNAIAIALNGTQSNVWVTNGGNNTVTVLDLEGNLLGNTSGSSDFGRFNHPRGVAVVPTSKRVFVTNRDAVPPAPYPGNLGTPYSVTVIEYTTPINQSLLTTFNTSPGPAGFKTPLGVAIDNNDDFWVTNESINTVSHVNGKTEVPIGIGTFNPFGFINRPSALAIDSLGYVWVTNEGGNTVTELSPDGGGLNFRPSGANFISPDGVAIDTGGNVWVANYFPDGLPVPGGVSELIGAAAPVKTPLLACLGPCKP